MLLVCAIKLEVGSICSLLSNNKPAIIHPREMEIIPQEETAIYSVGDKISRGGTMGKVSYTSYTIAIARNANSESEEEGSIDSSRRKNRDCRDYLFSYLLSFLHGGPVSLSLLKYQSK